MKPPRRLKYIPLFVIVLVSSNYFLSSRQLKVREPAPVDSVANVAQGKVNNGKTRNKSGCELHSQMTAVWTRNTAEENEIFWNVQACNRRLFTSRKEAWDKNVRPAPSSLRCEDDIMNEIEAILLSFDSIVFMGDSLIRQQYLTLLCVLDPYIQISNITFPLKPNVTGFKVYGAMGFVYREPQNTSATISIKYIEARKRIHQNRYFNDLTGTNATRKDLLIINQGAWYPPLEIRILFETVEGVLARAQISNASIFFMETVNFEWPSSNGEHLKGCSICKCEALTADRIRGDGNFTGPPEYLKQGGFEVQEFILKRLQPMHPDIMERNFSSSSSQCIPYCLPANWRNDVVHYVLSSSPQEPPPVTVVPIWKQLVSFGHPQNRHDGDCTHKSTDALLAMTQQLLRSMQRQAMTL
eukprot:scaffold1008_cov124-Cylindrotheca_fusiformis.AAC.18